MNATLVDLRYRTKDIMRAIERQETVKIFSRGKLKAELVPAGTKAPKKKARMSAMDHPLFGSRKDDTEPVQAVVRHLRAGRYDH